MAELTSQLNWECKMIIWRVLIMWFLCVFYRNTATGRRQICVSASNLLFSSMWEHTHLWLERSRSSRCVRTCRELIFYRDELLGTVNVTDSLGQTRDKKTLMYYLFAGSLPCLAESVAPWRSVSAWACSLYVILIWLSSAAWLMIRRILTWGWSHQYAVFWSSLHTYPSLLSSP